MGSKRGETIAKIGTGLAQTPAAQGATRFPDKTREGDQRFQPDRDHRASSRAHLTALASSAKADGAIEMVSIYRKWANVAASPPN